MRRLLKILAFAAAGLALLALSLPWWFGAVAGTLAARRGIVAGAYERIGYSRLAWHDVVVPVGSVRVVVDRIEADTPALWAWRHVRGRAGLVVAGSWRVEVGPPGAPADPRGWMPLRERLGRIADVLARWLPQAKVGPGVVRWSTGTLELAGATWRERELSVAGLNFRGVTADVEAAFASTGGLRVQATTAGGAVELEASSQGRGVSGTVHLWRQPASFGATFAASGWLPSEAELRASDWTVAGERLRVGAAYPEVRGGARVTWREGALQIDLNAQGAPAPGTAVPPLDLAVRAAGDRAGLALDTLRVEVPGISGLLTAPVFVDWRGRLREGEARFTVTADLGRVPWFTAQGTVAGEARLVSASPAETAVELSVAAGDVVAEGVALASASARGRFEWPLLDVQQAEVRAAAGGELRGRGGWDFAQKALREVSVEGVVHRESVARWLPGTLQFEQLAISATADGPLAAPVHAGTVRAGKLQLPALHPLAATATWRGRGGAVEEWTVEAAAGPTTIAARGALAEGRVQLAAASLGQDGRVQLALEAPAAVSWRPERRVEGLALAGAAGRIQIDGTWGASGRLAVLADGLASTLARDLAKVPGPPWSLRRLALTADWERGPARFAVEAAGAVELGEKREAEVELRGRGDGGGVRLDQVRVAESGAVVAEASGQLPVALQPGGDPFVRIERSGAIKLLVRVAPQADFWRRFATLSGVALEEPRLVADLHGTWARPEGTATLQARRVTIDPKWTAQPLPVIEGLDVEVAGDRAGLNLSRFELQVAGQRVHAGGRLPIPEEHWGEFLAEPLKLAREGADLRVEVAEAELAAFARWLPAAIAPVGRLEADVRFRNGGLEGFLRLRDAASRPLGPLGVLQEISADLALEGRRIRLEQVTARSGGQEVKLAGEVALGDDRQPRYDLTLRGTNLPFVRQTGLLVRGDLDLQLQTPADGAPTRLGGTVRLRDSLFLSDVRDLLPKGGAGPTRRPPYFAVETPPVNAWTLAVEVTGERFMRVRIPVFTGLASARFKLGGTLGEPRATGEVVIDEGTIKMPFAGFTVTQGSVRLTEADALEPEIFLRGTGRRYGYELTLQIEGRASEPSVVFTSSPPLDSEQVLLMVMTGSAPGNEIARSTTQRAANLGLFLGQSLLSGLGPDSAEADRLTIMSGEKVSQQGRETYEFEYQLSDRWTLTAEYNEFDEYNAGVKWRVFGGRRPNAQSHDAK